MAIKLKNDKDIAKMRVSGRLAAEVLEMIGEYVVPGVSTEDFAAGGFQGGHNLQPRIIGGQCHNTLSHPAPCAMHRNPHHI